MFRILTLPAYSSTQALTHRLRLAALVLLAALALSGCGYNSFQQVDEQVKASVAAVYRCRAPL